MTFWRFTNLIIIIIIIIIIAHQPLLVTENHIDYPIKWCHNFSCMFLHFVTKHACDRRTDRRTDRITIRASRAALHGKNRGVMPLIHEEKSVQVILLHADVEIKKFSECSAPDGPIPTIVYLLFRPWVVPCKLKSWLRLWQSDEQEEESAMI